MKQEREKSLLYTSFQEINKVNSPPFQGIIGSKDSKNSGICSQNNPLTPKFAAIYAKNRRKLAFFGISLDYDRETNLTQILNKSTAAAYRCFSALQMLIFMTSALQMRKNGGTSIKQEDNNMPSKRHPKTAIIKPYV